ncbi:hypothetical protein CG394_04675 [Gardnerella vaginalis]|jgi:hypothetical protein|uniref:Uncharacterized protein n=4 Tax=Gardnerella vaginalis TaxID=2702 RepID=A0A133NYW0_GARVA|nr:hypothetical protein [Gardnerella vaginalis]ADP38104.1 hypothetical protein HMPREF0421_20018 [Gardnerella vaginalis ATCC 14019]EPI43684.1 hypothetical protein HMPREF1584_00494 [Gardnerella vaginalis JCP8481A]EPI44669.1 hypothetical protein HMPREF1585_00101 [Gardnerella vaginalis JCP8481B]RIY23054.1 hypothetical protein CJI50_07195 [Bifidobacteriaceae bacterium NR021]TCH82706.1 hypothetical protein E0E46_01360 [Gardnerella vaginalis ATCC 14018 = JCM 11026]
MLIRILAAFILINALIAYSGLVTYMAHLMQESANKTHTPKTRWQKLTLALIFTSVTVCVLVETLSDNQTIRTITLAAFAFLIGNFSGGMYQKIKTSNEKKEQE